MRPKIHLFFLKLLFNQGKSQLDYYLAEAYEGGYAVNLVENNVQTYDSYYEQPPQPSTPPSYPKTVPWLSTTLPPIYDYDYYSNEVYDSGYELDQTGGTTTEEPIQWYQTSKTTTQATKIEQVEVEIDDLKIKEADFKSLWNEFLAFVRMKEKGVASTPPTNTTTTEEPTTTSTTTTSTTTTTTTTTPNPTPTEYIHYKWTTPNIPTTTPKPTLDPLIAQQNQIISQKILAELLTQDGKINPAKYKCRLMEETMKINENMIADLAIALVKDCYRDARLRVPVNLHNVFRQAQVEHQSRQNEMQRNGYNNNNNYWDSTEPPPYAKEIREQSNSKTTPVFEDVKGLVGWIQIFLFLIVSLLRNRGYYKNLWKIKRHPARP